MLTRNINKNKKIYHCNDVHQELAKMELSARRILYMCLSELERDVVSGLTTIKFDPEQVFTITAKDYSQLCNIDISEAYKQLKDGVIKIISYSMKVPESVLHPEGRGKPKDFMHIFTVANDGGYSDGEGFVEIKLSPKFAPYISDLTKDFTGQFLLSALRVPKGNAYNLYLLLSRWIGEGKIGYCELELSELKRELGAEGVTFDRFSGFKNLFINRAVKQILAITEFTHIKMEIIQKRGRKAHKVRVSYEYRDQIDKYDEAGFVVKASKPAKNLAASKVKLSPSERYRQQLIKEGKTPKF